MLAAGAILALVMTLYCFKKAVKAHKNGNKDGTVGLGFLVVVLFIPTVGLTIESALLISAWIAPKVYLLERLAQIIN